MYILGIDTSCDETSVAILNDHKVVANVISSQIALHQKWGGVVPILAKKAHEDNFSTVLTKAIEKAQKTDKLFLGFKSFDRIAVTAGPGLGIALEVGIRYAKTISTQYSLPIYPVNHLRGHIYSVFLDKSFKFEFPYLALLVSGKHTQIIIMHDHENFETLGSTLDDAAGEALDKIARLMGLGYPGGQTIESLARDSRGEIYPFPLPMAGENLNFSFSGLKTSFYNYYQTLENEAKIKQISFLAKSFQQAVIRALLYKMKKAAKKTAIKNWLLVGGVAANRSLKAQFSRLASEFDATVLAPPKKSYTGDNGAMIALAALYQNEHLDFANLSTLDRAPNWKIETSYTQVHNEVLSRFTTKASASLKG